MIECTKCRHAKILYQIDREEAFNPRYIFSGYVYCYKPSYKNRRYLRRDYCKSCAEYDEKRMGKR